MSGLAIIFLTAGYVLVYTGFNGDGTNPGHTSSTTYSIGKAFQNAANGVFVHPQGAAA